MDHIKDIEWNVRQTYDGVCVQIWESEWVDGCGVACMALIVLVQSVCSAVSQHAELEQAQ